MSRCILVGFIFLAAASVQAGEDVFRQTLISTGVEPIKAPTALSGKKITPDCPAAWSVRKHSLRGGKQEGVDILEVQNGVFTITVIPTRGMGIARVNAGPLRLGWDSPVKDIVHPKFVNLAARGGLGWLDGFNEWLCRCGLENVGQPGPDTIVTNTGDTATIDLPLHGRIANIPAEFVELVVQTKAPYQMTLRGVVRESMLFGPNLELRTEIVMIPGASSFTIRDAVVNVGASPQEFQLLYHFNFGVPLLDSSTKLVAPLQGVKPFNARAAKDAKQWDAFKAPTAGYVEQVYLLRPLADDKDTTTLLLHRPDKAMGCSMTYSTKSLPYLTLWKNTGAKEDGYVIGIEPGTSYPNRRQVERAAGRVPKLQPKEKHEVALEIHLHTTAKEVDRVVERIRTIQGDRKITVDD